MKLFSVKEDKSITVNMLLWLLLLFTWMSISQQSNYFAFIFITCYNLVVIVGYTLKLN